MEPCVIIPAYNAAATIAEVVRESLDSGFPVAVVDDGSVDATAAAAEKAGATLLRHPRNLGKGAALRTGFRWCLDNGFDGAVTIDADGQHDPPAIPRLVTAAKAEDCGILIASRAAQFSRMAGLRHYWNRFGAWCMRSRTGYDISDSQSGFRYYSASLLAQVDLSASGYALEMEVLLKGWRKGFRIGSIDVDARVADGRATSHFRPVRDTWNICMTFFRYR